MCKYTWPSLTQDHRNAAEYAPLDDLYSPVIHRVNQVIRARAVDEHGSVGPIPPTLLKYSQPPDALVMKTKPKIDSLIKAADVKLVKGKSNSLTLRRSGPWTHGTVLFLATIKGKGKRQRETSQTTGPISGIDVVALLREGEAAKRKKISKGNSIPEFKQILADASEEKAIAQAVKDMGRIVQSLIKESTGDSNYNRALENIGVMREQMIDYEMPGLYNDFLRDLKTKLQSDALEGDRKEMWHDIRWAKGLGLITKDQSEPSDVTAEEALRFLRG